MHGGASPGAAKGQSKRPCTGVAQRLLDLGNRLIASGDLYGGRLVLAEAATEGNASAALNLGSSFDPSEDGSMKKGSSDLEQAKLWYLRAKQLGEQNAQGRLDKLNSLAAPR
jgi:TPR repeat protein